MLGKDRSNLSEPVDANLGQEALFFGLNAHAVGSSHDVLLIHVVFRSIGADYFLMHRSQATMDSCSVRKYAIYKSLHCFPTQWHSKLSDDSSIKRSVKTSRKEQCSSPKTLMVGKSFTSIKCAVNQRRYVNLLRRRRLHGPESRAHSLQGTALLIDGANELLVPSPRRS
jgi:hypothetical protein